MMKRKQAILCKLVENRQQGVYFKNGEWHIRGKFTREEIEEIVLKWVETSEGRETGNLTPLGKVELTAYETENGEIPIKIRGR